MKNNRYLKRFIILTLCIIFLFTIIFSLVSNMEYQNYNYQYNIAIDNLISKLKEEKPDISEKEIIDILEDTPKEKRLLEKYGYDINETYINNESIINTFKLIKLLIFILFVIVLYFIIYLYNTKYNKRIYTIIHTLEKINQGIYDINLQDMNEDNLSILKEEIYKTTIMLKSMAENSQKDKIKLKDSLEDISHQIRTPLTSIFIMIDNIIDDPEMTEETKNNFIKQIKRELININFLVNSLLKLSKFDVNTIAFHNDNYKIDLIVKEAIQNIINLSDLKNIKINIKNNCHKEINCDYKWQSEAIANILKNSLEHSSNNSHIDIELNSNNIYVEVKIKDYGSGIDKEDLKHLFERFYKGKNSSSDSVGIGLALAKAIIEKDNGKIFVESKVNKGTTFIIKYFFK